MKINRFLPLLGISILLSFTQVAVGNGNDNPVSVTGDYNGQVMTAGSYDPYTGNSKRVVDDLTVQGSVGAYPLKWSRTLNTRGGVGPMGDGGTWRHSYQWGLWMRDPGNIGGPDPYEGPDGQIQYPDGRVVTIDYVNQPNWQPEDGVYEMGGGSYLVGMRDGGTVRFDPVPHLPGLAGVRPTEITDPHGLKTTLSYDNLSRLIRVTEPAGRYLQITWTRYSWSNPNGTTSRKDVVSKVQAFAGTGAPAYEEVNYSYTPVGVNAYVRYYNLTQVNYADGGQASYTYYPPQGNGTLTATSGRIQTCDDVRYDGPMKRIAYEYQDGTIHGQIGTGWVNKEKNLTTQQTVSELIYPDGEGPYGEVPLYRTEKRPDGRTRTFTYGGCAQYDLYAYTDFKGQPSFITWDFPNWPNSYRMIFTDARGKRTWTDKNMTVGAVTRITYPDSPPPPGSTQPPYVELTYSNYYYLASRRDENGNTTYFDRDGNGRIWRNRYPDGSSEQFVYNGFGQVTSHTMTSGGVETSTYDGRGLKTGSWPPGTPSDSNPSTHPTSYFYYTSGPQTDRLQRVQDPRGNSTWYEYNLRGQVTKVTHHDATYTQSGYNLDGTLAWSADENHPNASYNENERTRYSYDEYKRVLTVTNPLNQTSTNNYGPWSGIGSLSHTTNSVYQASSPMGKQVIYDYDENFRRTALRKGWGSADDDGGTYYGYDAVGNLTAVQDPRGNLTAYGYDERNRKTSQTDPAPFSNQVTQWQYDVCGNKTREIRPDNSFRSWDYDTMNRLYHAYDWRTNDPPNPNQTTLYYRGDAARNLNAIVDAKGATYGYGYDALNRKTSATYPPDANGISRNENWDYDSAGNLAHYTNPAGQVKTFDTYDNRNRLRHSYWSSNGPGVATEFDAASRVTSIVTNSGETSIAYGYDDANRQIWEDQTLAGYPTRRVETPRDGDGNRQQLYSAGIYSLSYDYTQRGQVWQIRDGGGSPFCRFTYDVNGNLTKRQGQWWWQNSTNLLYDQLNRITMAEQTGYMENAFARTWYQYDSLSREVAQWRDEDVGRGERFSYDVTNQLLNAAYNGQYVWTGNPVNVLRNVGFAYTPDHLNRSSVTENGVATSYGVASGMNQYPQKGGVTLLYDGNFSLTSYFGAIYTYDAERHLKSASKDGTTMQCIYDGVGRCVKRVFSGTTTGTILYTYAGWQPIMEWDGAGGFLAWNVYGSGADELLMRYDVRYGYAMYKLDGHGNVAYLLDPSNVILEQYRYDAFGKPTITAWADWNGTNPRATSAYGNRFMFTGREYFAEISIYDYRHRMYQPGLGRFLQTDPTGFDAGDMNLFRYCGDDPVNHTDPTGLYTSSSLTSFGGGDWAWFNGGEVLKQLQAQRDQAAGSAGSSSGSSGGYSMAYTVVMPGYGPQTKGSNQRFVDEMKDKFDDAVVYGREQAAQKRAVEAIKQARKNGDNTVNIAGYSRGAIGAIQLARRLAGEGISVNRLVTVDPVTATGNSGSIGLPSNIQRADNFYQRGARMGLTDFPGTPLIPAPNVSNTFYRDGMFNGYQVRHENMPAIAEIDQ